MATIDNQLSSFRGPMRRTFGFSAIVIALAAALLAAMTLGVSIGSVRIDPVDVWRVIGNKTGFGVTHFGHGAARP